MMKQVHRWMPKLDWKSFVDSLVLDPITIL
jgi:hypothetical protein